MRPPSSAGGARGYRTQRRRPAGTPSIHMQMRKLPRPARHCSPTGVSVSPGLTYYVNFRKTLTRGTRVIDTHPLAAGEPVNGSHLFALGSTPTGKWKEVRNRKRRRTKMSSCVFFVNLLVNCSDNFIIKCIMLNY